MPIFCMFSSHFFANLAQYASGRYEGRILKSNYTEGGYENLEELHEFSYPINRDILSKDFLKEYSKFIIHDDVDYLKQ